MCQYLECIVYTTTYVELSSLMFCIKFPLISLEYCQVERLVYTIIYENYHLLLFTCKRYYVRWCCHCSAFLKFIVHTINLFLYSKIWQLMNSSPFDVPSWRGVLLFRHIDFFPTTLVCFRNISLLGFCNISPTIPTAYHTYPYVPIPRLYRAHDNLCTTGYLNIYINFGK